MSELNIQVRDVRTDGYPDMEALVGRVAFIFDGCVVSGWPLPDLDEDGLRMWDPNSDVGRVIKFAGVTKWLEFPEPVWEIERAAEGDARG